VSFNVFSMQNNEKKLGKQLKNGKNSPKFEKRLFGLKILPAASPYFPAF
jgi:hypothetical protein